MKHCVITKPFPQSSPPCRVPPQAVLPKLLLHLPKGCLHKIRWLQILSQQSHPLNYPKEQPTSFHWLHKKPNQTAQHNLIILKSPDPLTHWALWLALCTFSVLPHIRLHRSCAADKGNSKAQAGLTYTSTSPVQLASAPASRSKLLLPLSSSLKSNGRKRLCRCG